MRKYLDDVSATEIEAVTDKKFILELILTDHFAADLFEVNGYTLNEAEYCGESDYEDMQEYVLRNFDNRFTNYIVNPEVSFNGSAYGDTEWELRGKTKPLTAQEVLKIKYADVDDVDGAIIVDLV